MTMILVMGHAKLAPGEIDRLLAAMQTQLEATRAEEGCIHYSFSRDVLDPDTLRIAEQWRDWDAINTHFVTPHMQAFNAEMGKSAILEIKVTGYGPDGEVRPLIGG
jgi:quinol monooxygenase YgiN